MLDFVSSCISDANVKSVLYYLHSSVSHVWTESAVSLWGGSPQAAGCGSCCWKSIQYRCLLCFSPSQFLCSLRLRPFPVGFHYPLYEIGVRTHPKKSLHFTEALSSCSLCAICTAWKLCGRLNWVKLACIYQNNRKNNLIYQHLFSSTCLFCEDANTFLLVDLLLSVQRSPGEGGCCWHDSTF